MIQNDIEIDRIRAENAVKTRQLELRLEGLRTQIGQLTTLASSGRAQIEELTQELAACEARLLEREDELAAANAKISALRQAQPAGADVTTPLNEQHRRAVTTAVQEGNPKPETTHQPIPAEASTDQLQQLATTRSEIEKRVAHLTAQLARLHQAGSDLGLHLEQQRLATDQAQNRAVRLAEQLVGARHRIDELEAQLEKRATDAVFAEQRLSQITALHSKEHERGIRLCSKLKAKQALLREVQKTANKQPAHEAPTDTPIASTQTGANVPASLETNRPEQQTVTDSHGGKTLDLAVAARMVSEVNEHNASPEQHSPKSAPAQSDLGEPARAKGEEDGIRAGRLGQFEPSPAST